MMLSKEKERLRELAKRQRDWANSPHMQQLRKLWMAHNSYHQERPMVQLELWELESELVAPRLCCNNPLARQIEADLLRTLIPVEEFGDDQIVPDYFPVQWKTWFNLFGHEIRGAVNDAKQLGHRFEALFHDLEEDLPRLEPSTWGVDRGGTRELFDTVNDVIGDLLPARMTMGCLYSVPTQEIVHRMSMEDMYLSMYDCPDAFKGLMQRIVDDTKAYFRWLEAEKLLLPTTDCQRLNQASYCFTTELPEKADHLTSRDVWGFMDSQETVGISPDMFEEFIFPYYRQIADEFGLLSYGCCEPVHPIWDRCISTLPNLRKVSISPWCDEAFMSERLRGRNVVFHRKPSPNLLGVSSVLDEGAIRAHFLRTIEAARGCTLEFSIRDVYTLNGRPENARRFVEILRQCIDKAWRP